VAIVGSSGVGKTWLAERLAAALDVVHVELDAIHHGPDWAALPADEMRRELDLRCPAAGAWVADGNYETKGGDLVRDRADTIVWLDFPRLAVMRQLTWRTARRGLLRQRLWNGNRESLRNALSLDPARSVLLWSWTRHEPQRRRYAAQRDRRWVRLTKRAEVRQFLMTAEASASQNDS
jgi:adenylate kinase family enzyme